MGFRYIIPIMMSTKYVTFGGLFLNPSAPFPFSLQNLYVITKYQDTLYQELIKEGDKKVESDRTPAEDYLLRSSFCVRKQLDLFSD